MNLDEALTAAQEKLAAPEPEPISEAAPVVEAAPKTTPAPPSEAPKPAAADWARDGEGRFAKAGEKPAAQKPPAAPKGGVHGAAQAEPPGQGKAEGAVSPAAPSTLPVKPDAAPLKLPSSWKPPAREALAKAPREVQEEAVRIDREVRQVMQEAAPLKQRAAEIDRALAPFEGIARASGMDVMSYAGSVMQTAAMLFQGPVGNRPALIAQLIKQAGINPEDVNPFLYGERSPSQPQQPAFDPRAEVQKVLQEERQRQEAEASQRAVQEFTATQPEFFDDVWTEMVAIIEADKRAGRNPDLKRAYDRACRMNEDVSKILEQRKAAEAARTANTATQGARAAATSIKSSLPAPQVGAKTKGIDGAMEKARAKLGL